jgi:hypothetical protein
VWSFHIFSFHYFVISISADVLRKIRPDVAENLGGQEIARMAEDNEASSPD